MMRMLARISVVIGAIMLIASFGGDLHPIGDSLAVFRVAILGAVLLLAVTVWRWRIAQGAIAISLVLLGSTLAQGMPDRLEQSADLVLYQKNLLYLTTDRAGFVDDVIGSGADFVTLQEVSPANRYLLDELRDAYPYQLPVQVRVIGVHLPWPWPRRQAAFVETLLPDFQVFRGDVTLVGGDFNMVPAGRSIARVARATGTQRVGHIERTYQVLGYPIAIDHVLASAGATGTIEVRPRLGSDHFGVLARVALP